MYALLAYDIASNRERTKLHKKLKEYGLNTQRSLFECQLEKDTLIDIVRMANKHLDPEHDKFRIYMLCNFCYKRVQVSGLGLSLELTDYKVL
jgi:CRISPR-associated protein Cas2